MALGLVEEKDGLALGHNDIFPVKIKTGTKKKAWICLQVKESVSEVQHRGKPTLESKAGP